MQNAGIKRIGGVGITKAQDKQTEIEEKDKTIKELQEENQMLMLTTIELYEKAYKNDTENKEAIVEIYEMLAGLL